MLYRWPQGRIIRTVLMVLTLVVAVDLGYKGYVTYGAWTESRQAVGPLVLAIVMAVAAIGALIGGFSAIGVVPRSAQFLIEVEEEMAKVTWPTRAEVTRFTILIALTAVVLSIVVFLVDFINTWIVYQGTRLLGGGQ